MANYNRSTVAIREMVNFELRVTGYDTNGRFFAENTKTYDLSEDGIAFYLNTSVWINSSLTIDIMTSDGWDSKGALVIRIRTDSAGRNLVAAFFR